MHMVYFKKLKSLSKFIKQIWKGNESLEKNFKENFSLTNTVHDLFFPYLTKIFNKLNHP